MRLILFGAPGVGKGTQARRITQKAGIPQISTGDILRNQIRSGSELGQKLKSYTDQGNLVPDGLILDIIRLRLAQPDCEGGFILDGFPRTVAQAEALEVLLVELKAQLDHVFELKVSDDAIVRRLSSRRVCRSCGEVYNSLLEEIPEECRHCGGGPIAQRPDDQEETIRHRLEVFNQQTAPLLEFYDDRGLLRSLDGDRSVDEVHEELMSLLV